MRISDWSSDVCSSDLDNVLGIGISMDDSLANRPTGFQTTFRNTQGMKHAVNGGAGDMLIADLYIPTSWSAASQGARRPDMRSEERRVGKECVSTCRYRGAPYLSKKNKKHKYKK